MPFKYELVIGVAPAFKFDITNLLIHRIIFRGGKISNKYIFSHVQKMDETRPNIFIYIIMDYGRPMKPFFNKILNFWDWANKLG